VEGLGAPKDTDVATLYMTLVANRGVVIERAVRFVEVVSLQRRRL